MRARNEAIDALVEAEDRLAGLMREGLEEHRYDDVAAIAEVAQRFSEFLRSLEGSAALPQEEATRPRSKQRRSGGGRPGAKQPSVANRAAYPKFRRDGDRLVKVGWSRKGRKEYEQRAPVDVVRTFSALLRDRKEPGSVFVMNDLLPLKDDAGRELPSYQAYLVLGWLRAAGVVVKNGRDGYRADPSRLSRDFVNGLLEEVPSLGAPRD